MPAGMRRTGQEGHGIGEISRKRLAGPGVGANAHSNNSSSWLAAGWQCHAETSGATRTKDACSNIALAAPHMLLLLRTTA